jgi:dipeptidyl aminopeptidase/acylaminoacyl peptidase
MRKNLLLIMAIAATITACTTKNEKKDAAGSDEIIGKKTLKIEDGRLSPEVMLQLGQVGGVQISPDNKTALYAVTYTDIALNKRNTELFTVNIDGSGKRQITKTPKSESDAQWFEGGKKIAFIYEGQVWAMNPDGSKRYKLTDYEKDIEGFKFSPDEQKLLFISTVKTIKTANDSYPDLDKASGRIIDSLMYKHWDEWTETAPHPFVAEINVNTRQAASLQNAVDLLEGEPYESPLRPFGGTEQFAWSPDSKTIAYTCRKKTGKDYAESTNSDIFLYNIETKEVKNLTEGIGGYDTNPQYSPDGQYIAWLSMARDGYESDKNRLMVANLGTENFPQAEITKFFDYDVNDFCWTADAKGFYFVSCVNGTTQIFYTENSAAQQGIIDYLPLTSGVHDYASVALAGDALVGLRHSMAAPNEVFVIKDSVQTNISKENDDILAQIKMGKMEDRWIKTTDGKDMLTWVIYPPDFDPAKKYPAILFCEGGPQSTVSQFWSTRWNMQLIAAKGYIVVAPNRRGCPGFGSEWKEQISGDYGGQNMKDYFSAIDAMAKEPYVDETRLGCTGASYGGFSVYWLAGHHNKRFKAFWAHAGIFNVEAQYLETEEMWFANWDLGGPFWDKSNAVAQRSFANSPHRFVGEWDTPIAVSCGELDFRILASQGMMAFNAAQLRGIPSRMLIYPDENHWILKPQNSVLFHREFFRWFDRWLK